MFFYGFLVLLIVNHSNIVFLFFSEIFGFIQLYYCERHGRVDSYFGICKSINKGSYVSQKSRNDDMLDFGFSNDKLEKY